MTDTTDLKARLRLIAAWKKPGGKTPAEKMPNVHAACLEAADALDAKDRTIERLREALKPFALEGDNWGPLQGHDDLPLRTEAIMEEGWSYNLTVGDFRRAAESLKGQTP